MKLTVNNLHYRHSNQVILNNINLELDGNQVVSLLGPNGAGKSSLLKALSACLYCTVGEVRLDKLDVKSNRIQYLNKVGYMPEQTTVLAELTTKEQLQLHLNLKNIENKQHALEKVLETCQLQAVINKRTQNLSLGYKQRLNLAQALLSEPEVLIMDEPLNGLDPHLIIEFRNIIKKLKQHTLIIMSTHYLTEAEIISDRVLIMQEGKLLDNIKMNQVVELEKAYMQHTMVNS